MLIVSVSRDIYFKYHIYTMGDPLIFGYLSFASCMESGQFPYL